MKSYRLFILFLLPLSFVLSSSSSTNGCDADTEDNIFSSEIASSLAADIEIVADIYEYNNLDWADVSAHVQTIASQTDINFDQGETLTVQYETADGLSDPVYLYQEESGEPYSSAFVEKTIDGGTYVITYTDKDGLQTAVTLQSYNTLDITSIADGSLVEDNPVTLTWNTALVEGTVAVAYECGSHSYAYTSIENTGSYLLSHACTSGVGAIKLRHQLYASSAEGFGQAAVTMYNIIEKNVSFDVAEVVVEPVDADADGYSVDEDCDDTNAAIHPGATEICEDGIDQNCNDEDAACPADESSSGGCSLDQNHHTKGTLSVFFLFACSALLLYGFNKMRGLNF